MKKLMFAIMILGSTLAMGQDLIDSDLGINNKLEQFNSVTVNVILTKDFIPDYYEVKVIIQEYDHINPNNQETKLITINEIEKTFYEKSKTLGIKKSDIKVLSVLETKLNTNYNSNYNSTQKRKISKSYVFTVVKMEDLEDVYKTMRVNGVLNVLVTPRLSKEKESESDSELINDGIKTAKKKASLICSKTNNKILNVSNVLENNYYANQYSLGYTNNNYSNLYQDLNKIQKTISLSVTFKVK
ncbi:MAG: hypothetical protein CMD20_02800 [Flavobacteriales bacterium]|nr:hypothetical protein [Flavobacteriales bacterium]|tara:strand:+ start:7718 stop:8446 length:729 start_codon:yes stop_codon:yes gene_type:complete